MKKNALVSCITFVLLLVLTGQIALAQSFDSFNISFDIAYSKAVVNEKMVFHEPVSGNIMLELPKSREGLSVAVDGRSIAPSIISDTLTLNLNSSKRIELSYTTRDFVEGNEFIASFSSPYDIDELYVRLTLPDNTVLYQPLSDSALSSGSAYPKPSEASTDGQSITLKWYFSNVKRNDEKSFFVKYKSQTGLSYMIMAIVAGVVLIAGIAYLMLSRKPEVKEVEKVVEKIVEKKEGFEKHLKEDEEQVVNILKQREGQCEQGTLRVITGFSKAKLSGLLKELEDRNIIYKEKRGKKNLVFLREQ